ncbi:MAG: hypothetical protein ACR2J8_05705 [Thermomicrobiales bacterium]
MTALAATLHDPDARMLPLLEQHAPLLASYAAAAIAITHATTPNVATLLRERGVNLVSGGPDVGAARRDAIAAASHAARTHDVLCIDFDRWLHWAGCYPDELLALPGKLRKRRPAPWYACVGRTPRAWKTHPAVQQACEAPTNRALSIAAEQDLDATAGCSWLSPEGVVIVLSHSTEATNATDLEWPGFILRHDPLRLTGIRVEGLEFETPDFYPREIAAAGGRDAWIAATYERPAMYATRLGLAADSAAALARVKLSRQSSPGARS